MDVLLELLVFNHTFSQAISIMLALCLMLLATYHWHNQLVSIAENLALLCHMHAYVPVRGHPDMVKGEIFCFSVRPLQQTVATPLNLTTQLYRKERTLTSTTCHVCVMYKHSPQHLYIISYNNDMYVADYIYVLYMKFRTYS